jgi:hypothetical protein
MFLFTNSAGGPIDYSNFSKKWRKVQEDLGITPRSPHNTRHTFATLMISRGENIAFASKILGHSSIKVTVDTYFKWIPKANRIAVEALDFTGQLPVQNGNEAAMEEKQRNNGKRKSLKKKNEPWRNRTSNLLIKSFCQGTDFIRFNILRGHVFRKFPHFAGPIRQQTGNSVMCSMVRHWLFRASGCS